MHWYIRSKNKVTGPFPAGQVQQSILLGRVMLNDEASKDKEEWKSVRFCPQLIPDVLRMDPKDEHAKERLAAAKRWADERRDERREDDDSDRKGTGRRDEESGAALAYRQNRETLNRSLKNGNERSFVGLIVVVLVMAVGGYAGFKYVPEETTGAQCDAVVSMGVNWSHCNKAGLQSLNANMSNAILNSTNLQGANLFGSNMSAADLSYADLSRANLSFVDFQNAQLKGANLRSADLSKANFTNADLSYANIQDANLHEVVFSGAKLDHVIWVNGKKCLPGSVGKCIVGK